jgi:glycosyltransferase involved in cell wall biosynthesis
MGWTTEVLIVDNGSTDGTAKVAAELGATVVDQPVRGYGNAYKAGFAAASGDVVVTGDADRTYPFDHIPELLTVLLQKELDFLTTNRLLTSNRGAMSPSHSVGNHALSALSRLLFRNRIVDSQSGMWVFRRLLWQSLDVRSGGMAFSQELKNEAFRRATRCLEVPIEYRPRGGEVKLRAGRDGARNALQLVSHRLRYVAAPLGRSDRQVGVRPHVDRPHAGFVAGRRLRSSSPGEEPA